MLLLNINPMPETIDILTADNGDLLISGGDFIFGDSEQQHIEDILVSDKGNWREYPICGVSITNYINAPLTTQNKTALERKIRLQLTHDGLTGIALEIQRNQIKVTANRIK